MTNATNSPAEKAPQWDRRWLWIGLVSLGLSALGIFYGIPAYQSSQAEREYAEAVAQADRLDPGWRLEELEAKRKEVAPEENGATLVLKPAHMIPKEWRGYQVLQPLWDVTPNTQLTSLQAVQLKAEQDAVAPVLAEVMQLADRSTGRFPLDWASNRFDSQYPHFDSTYSRGIPDLRSVLQVAQLLRTQQQDIQGALTCCRAALGLGRSYGDQPSLVAMNIRSTTNLKIVQMLERVLAQGQALDIDLHTLQQSLEDEASQPLFLIGARGERAEIDRIYQAAEDGSLSQAEFALLDDLVKPDRFLRKSYKQPRAADLRFWTQVVEIAKYPVEEQEAQFARLQGLSSPFNSGDGLAFGSIEGTGQRVGIGFRRAQARLRCSVAALAVERFRLANSRWPKSLGELCPEYLRQVPVDPYDGKPIGLERTNEGVLILCTRSPNMQNGEPPLAPFRLRDPDTRYRLSINPIVGPPGK